MITSDLTYRKLVRNTDFSAFFDLSFSNVTGSAEIGFSGSGKKYKFSFVSGKMFDDEGRYFSSYLPNNFFSLSTNFDANYYDYAINNEIVSYSGNKDNFNIENFYLDPSGVSITNSIIINSAKPSLTLSYPYSFITGQTITGHLVSDSISGVKLFTGSFEDLSSFEFLSLPTGYITSTESGQVLINQKSASVGEFATNASFNTNAGSYSQDIFITGVEASFLDYTFEYEDNNPDTSGEAIWSTSLSAESEETGITKVAETTFTYNFNTNDPALAPSTLPLGITFSYYSGTTGYYGLVTQATVTSGGNGYLSAPTVIFEGGGASVDASGTAILGSAISDYDQVDLVNLTYNGQGYTSVPDIVFSGGTGILNNETPTVATGSVDIAMYTKSFTGNFNIYTGIDGGYLNFNSNNLTSDSGYYSEVDYSFFDTPLNIKVEYTSTFDSDPLIGLLTISGAGGNIINSYITGKR